jgi:LysR family nod box-dependent transcriptional activator
MRFNRLDLNLLVALDALLSEKSITRASRRLNLSQSATSGVLARLREYFKDELLVPVGRNLILTPLAVSLAEPVRDVLLQIQRTIEIKPEFDPPPPPASSGSSPRTSSPLSCWASWAAASAPMRPAFRSTSRRPPRRPAEQLERGEVELVILPRKYMSESQPTALLFEETYTCIVWTGNTLVGDTLSWTSTWAGPRVVPLRHCADQLRRALPQGQRLRSPDRGLDHQLHQHAALRDRHQPHRDDAHRLARMLACYYPIRLVAAADRVSRNWKCACSGTASWTRIPRTCGCASC